MFHGAPPLAEASLALGKYLGFLEKLVEPFFCKRFIEFAQVGCEGDGPVAGRKVSGLSIFGDGDHDGLLPSRGHFSSLPAEIVELQ